MLKSFIESNADNVIFYKDSFRRYIYLALFFLVINFILLIYLFYTQLTVKVAPDFATTSDGRLIQIHPGKKINRAVTKDQK